MSAKSWGNAYRTTTVCIDSYRDGNPVGRFYNPYHKEGIPFQSMTQFLVRMEQAMDEMELPKAFTETRSFMQPAVGHINTADLQEQTGREATFALKVLFRQNTSWQGLITWLEGRQEQSFRSVLELICLIDSALAGEKSA